MFRFLSSSSVPFHSLQVTDRKKSAIPLAKSLTCYISCKGDSAWGRRWQDIINICLRASRQLRWLTWCTLRQCSDLHDGKHCFNHSILQSKLQIIGTDDPIQSTTWTCPSALLCGCHRGLWTASPKDFFFYSRILSGCLSWVTEASICVEKITENKQQRII